MDRRPFDRSEFEESVDALVDGELLDESELTVLREQLEASEEARGIHAETRSVKATVAARLGAERAPAGLRERLEQRIREERGTAIPSSAAPSSAGSPSAASPSAASPSSEPAASGRIIRPSRFRRILSAAAIVAVATLVFLFVLPSKLDHYAAARGLTEAFLDGIANSATTSPAGSPTGSANADLEAMRAEIRSRFGVELAPVPVIPGCVLVGWARATVAGHAAIRVDFRPRDLQNVPTRGGGPALVSVFLMPLTSLALTPEMAAALDAGHQCEKCINFQDRGTLFCVRRDELLVAAVSNAGPQSFTSELEVR